MCFNSPFFLHPSKCTRLQLRRIQKNNCQWTLKEKRHFQIELCAWLWFICGKPKGGLDKTMNEDQTEKNKNFHHIWTTVKFKSILRVDLEACFVMENGEKLKQRRRIQFQIPDRASHFSEIQMKSIRHPIIEISFLNDAILSLNSRCCGCGLLLWILYCCGNDDDNFPDMSGKSGVISGIYKRKLEERGRRNRGLWMYNAKSEKYEIVKLKNIKVCASLFVRFQVSCI